MLCCKMLQILISFNSCEPGVRRGPHSTPPPPFSVVLSLVVLWHRFRDVISRLGMTSQKGYDGIFVFLYDVTEGLQQYFYFSFFTGLF